MIVCHSKNEHHFHHNRDSPLYHKVLHTHLFKDRVTAKANVDNYDGFTYPKRHIQSVTNIPNLVAQKCNTM